MLSPEWINLGLTHTSLESNTGRQFEYKSSYLHPGHAFSNYHGLPTRIQLSRICLRSHTAQGYARHNSDTPPLHQQAIPRIIQIQDSIGNGGSSSRSKMRRYLLYFDWWFAGDV